MVKILVVDDEWDILTEVDETLSDEGYVTICVDNVEDALEALRNDTNIRLVVTDLKMPGKSGADLINEARAEFERDIRFIVISGSPENFGLDIAQFHYLRKPVNIDKLLAAVAAVASQDAGQSQDEQGK